MTPLEQSAYAFAEAIEHAVSANACGIPHSEVAALIRFSDLMLDDLKTEAMNYFKDTYDGATE